MAWAGIRRSRAWAVHATASKGIISAADHGPGIPANDLPHLFERFYRGEKTRAREEGGSGLGLAIVQGLLVAIGGSIRVDSVEGAGTTFVVEVPLVN